MSTTTNKGIDIITIGSPNWGEPVNDNSEIIDKAFGDFSVVSGTSGNQTLTLEQYQGMCLKSSNAVFTENVSFLIPDGVKGQWVVMNRNTGASFYLQIRYATLTNSLIIPNGEVRTVYADGSNVFFIDTVTVPSGSVMMFAMNTAPTGWLKANGAAVSRTTYADLFAAIGTTFGVGDGTTTFNVPELRGEFLRAWDDGRGIDSGRAFGSAQLDQNEAHTHTGTTASAGTHTHTITLKDQGAGTSNTALGVGISSSTNTITTNSAGAHTHTFTTASSGGTEARPLNIALLACIKF